MGWTTALARRLVGYKMAQSTQLKGLLIIKFIKSSKATNGTADLTSLARLVFLSPYYTTHNMKLFHLSLLAVAALLSSAEACKCIKNGQKQNAVTESCCKAFGGIFEFGEDCRASSISERLTNFSACCGNSAACSDCRCNQCGNCRA